MEWTANLVSLAAYVLQAIGFYTIAKRRGIPHAWLAWIPVGSVWILGSISDDFKSRTTGRYYNKRKFLVALSAALLVLSFLTVDVATTAVLKVFTPEEVKELAVLSSEVGTDMYAMTEEEFFAYLEDLLAQRMTEPVVAELEQDVMNLLLLGLGCLAVGIWAAVLEWMSILDLYESTVPAKKTKYFLLGLFLGIQGVFIFLCRDKDAMPAALPPKEPWEN